LFETTLRVSMVQSPCPLLLVLLLLLVVSECSQEAYYTHTHTHVGIAAAAAEPACGSSCTLLHSTTRCKRIQESISMEQ